MNNIQIVTMVLVIPTSFIAMLIGVRLNDARLDGIRDLVNRRVDDFKNLLEAKIENGRAESSREIGDLCILIEKNHSELLLKFAEMGGRLTRIEGERRIVQ
jgi:hypothetical protein